MPALDADDELYEQAEDDAMPTTRADASAESETPHFDALFARYDLGSSCFGTEHLGSLLLDMGFSCAPRVLDRALDDMDPNATGEIAKLTFLEWFEANADEIDVPAGNGAGQGGRGSACASSPRRALGSLENDDADTGETDASALTQLTSAMLDAKNQRKRAEADVTLLSNRLMHLRAEEARAQKRIDEADRRAKEIEAVKKRNAEHQRAKQRAIEQLEQETKRTHDSNQTAAYTSRVRRHQSLNAVSALRAQLVQETRAQRQTHLARIQLKRDAEQRQLAERSKEIRAQEKTALRRRDVLKHNQHKELIRSAREKLAHEHQKTLLSERLIRQMEQEEAQLIERLRVSHELQRAAYEHLEFVIHDDDGV